MDAEALLSQVGRLKAEGFRLLMINATPLPSPQADGAAVELTWSFAKGARLEHLRERVPAGAQVPSVGRHYASAFLYENELGELFGVEVTGLEVDFKGGLYQTSTKVPFSVKAIRERLEAKKARAPRGKQP